MGEVDPGGDPVPGDGHDRHCARHLPGDMHFGDRLQEPIRRDHKGEEFYDGQEAFSGSGYIAA
eukprot:7537023-Pyramimonas_sp.AAC.1